MKCNPLSACFTKILITKLHYCQTGGELQQNWSKDKQIHSSTFFVIVAFFIYAVVRTLATIPGKTSRVCAILMLATRASGTREVK